MEKCLKVFKLLIEKKLASMRNDPVAEKEYQRQIEEHIKQCEDCRKLLSRTKR